MREAFAKQLYSLAKKDKNIFFITGDLGFGVFDNFAKKFPKQYLNVGVAEQNMIGIATGLGLEGKKVFVYSIANFATFRCLEQIRNDAAYHNINLTIVSSGGGFTYGSLGMSHHATEDIAIMRALPNTIVSVPSSAWETKFATRKLASIKGLCYLRIEKGGLKKPPFKNSKFHLGKSILYYKGKDITFIVAGSILEECLSVAERLKQNGFSARVLSMHTIKPIDETEIKKAAKETGIIITVEEHNESGGLGGAVAEVIAKSNIDCMFDMVAINNKFSSVVGDQSYLRKIYKINAESIYSKSKKLLKIKL